jgi:hypothetical protein
VVLIFLTFNDASWESPLYVVNDLVDYTLGGNKYTGLYFKYQLLTDDDKPPKGSLVVPNIDRRLGILIQSLVFSPSLALAVYAGSQWNTTIDVGTNSRLPIGTPSPEITAKGLFLWDVTAAGPQISITFGPPDITQELWPFPRTTKQNCPALFR